MGYIFLSLQMKNTWTLLMFNTQTSSADSWKLLTPALGNINIRVMWKHTHLAKPCLHMTTCWALCH